jgi:hypothetical protein
MPSGQGAFNVSRHIQYTAFLMRAEAMLHSWNDCWPVLSHFLLHRTCARWHKTAVVFAFLSNEHTIGHLLCNVGSYIAGEMASSAGHPLHWTMVLSANSIVRRSFCATSQSCTGICFAKVVHGHVEALRVTHGLRLQGRPSHSVEKLPQMISSILDLELHSSNDNPVDVTYGQSLPYLSEVTGS